MLEHLCDQVWVILGPEKNTTIMSNVIINTSAVTRMIISVLSTRNSVLCAPETIHPQKCNYLCLLYT